MAGAYRLTWNGPQVTARTVTAAAAGLAMAGEHLLNMSRREVPVQRGDLKRSGRVENDVANLSTSIIYDQPYATRQHEELGYRHEQGKAKYLEDPMTANAEVMAQLIATAIRRSLS